MKTTRYLYDVSPSVLASMSYEDAIRFKIERATELLHELVHVKNDPWCKKVEDLQKAIEFNKALLAEMEEEQ